MQKMFKYDLHQREGGFARALCLPPGLCWINLLFNSTTNLVQSGLVNWA